ncbi:unnamed protein product [Vitrella brassicaformis CCMP3155]|uniref:Uncharacterized protein n=1 Tax=Vitrella brassicaformis (strain CCMP3155) TaxID=1169540 RepID=A0A0G4EVS2_VITBC|nr:unnamed protein product [Vitrella brassicaformis CCMP3155]|eukprot:CEM02301.1 unnamed protein product [Vitrella brassicaformis CCMP3155]
MIKVLEMLTTELTAVQPQRDVELAMKVSDEPADLLSGEAHVIDPESTGATGTNDVTCGLPTETYSEEGVVYHEDGEEGGRALRKEEVELEEKVLLLHLIAAVGFAVCWALLWLAYWSACEKMTARAAGIVLDVTRRITVALCYIAIILLVAEGSAIGAVRRLRTTWYFFVLGFVPYVTSALFHHVEALRKHHKYAPLMHYPMVVLVPLMVFRRVAQNSKIIVRKRAHILKTWGFCTVTGIVRSLLDGPALQTSPAITFVAFGFALFPRFVQAKMEHISSQILWSLIFASFDFATDLAMPYSILISGAARRSLMRFLCRPVRDRHFDTVTAEDTQETRDKQTPVMLLSRLSTTMTMSFKSAGRYSVRSLSTFLDVPTQVVQFGYHPIFLRRLSDQMHAYSLTELTGLIFTNLSNITVGQILFPSVRHLLERLVGLGIMVLIEVFFEGALYIFLVRSANLPLIKSTTEPGVIRMHLLALGIGGTAIIIRNAPVLVLMLLTAADENKYRSVSTHEFCPFHSTMFELS